jgi:signal transduction histidine kinase
VTLCVRLTPAVFELPFHYPAASRAATEVTVPYASDALELEVCDDGPRSATGTAADAAWSGCGERVSVFGGELQAGPRPKGGFAVRARLPLDAVSR